MNRKILGIFVALLVVIPLSDMFPPADAILATGGTITNVGGKRIHTFTSSGFFCVTYGSGNVQYLVVGGGGGGGAGGGGGGAGGFKNSSSFAVGVGCYTATIGAGGAGVVGNNGANGGNSLFANTTANGGGGGGAINTNGVAGASGGGGGGAAGARVGGAGTAGQGHNGGDNDGTVAPFAGGGGGGAFAVGAKAPAANTGGAGGKGNSTSISGTSTMYAGGGGGSVANGGGTGGAGGAGGGGAGSGAAINSIGTSGTANTGGGGGGGGQSAPGKGGDGGSGIIIVSYVPSTTPPNSVTTLHTTSIGVNTADIAWSAPNMQAGTCSGYQINYTTPWGTPVTILLNNTGSCGTSYSISGLTLNTDYSVRVSARTQFGTNVTGANIINFTTLAFNQANYTIGSFNFNANNPLIFPIRFERIDNGTSDTRVNVTFSNTITLACDLRYTYAQTNHTYHSVSSIPISTTENEASFRFTNSSNDITTFHCWNQNGNQSANYVLTQTDFLLKQQVRDFRNGTYGTMGQFGAFDLITLIIVIISMIGLNRNTEAVAGIFCIAAISILAYFDIVSWITAIVSAACVILLFMVAGTKKT